MFETATMSAMWPNSLAWCVAEALRMGIICALPKAERLGAK